MRNGVTLGDLIYFSNRNSCQKMTYLHSEILPNFFFVCILPELHFKQKANAIALIILLCIFILPKYYGVKVPH